ncbi:retrovirus-related pol polyprotein from transposon TNT 1-94 [Tanacetum coccineum]
MDDLKKRLAKNNEAKMILPFTRFNTIITSLKALDEGYSSKNYVRKFLRALHPKWRVKVMAIEESKDLTSLSLDELIGNLKVHEMIIKKDFKHSQSKNAVVRIFSIGECPKPPKDKNQRAFVGGSWSDSGDEDDEKVKDETCLLAHDLICLGVDLEPNEWIKDSGCSKHMTGNRKLFSTYKAYNGGNVVFGSNLRGNIIGKESLNVTFDETPPPSKTSPLVDDDLDKDEAIREIEKKILENNVEDETLEIDEVVNIKESRNHPLENVTGNLNQRTLRS